MMNRMVAIHQRRIIVLLALAVLLPGCANTPSHNQEIARQHLSPGYLAEHHYAITSTRESWTLSDDTVDVTLMMPSGDGNFPLIVYLPGLGESAESGAAWRRPWAEAGYAVLAIQPDTVGRIWSAQATHNNEERKDIVREQFSPRSLDYRQSVLQKSLAEIKRRNSSSEATVFSHMDLTRIVIAGFDLGAQTAMFAAGEYINGIEPFTLPDAVKCIVALSPYADFSGAGFEQRFKLVHVPVISVTSMEDVDQYGLVTTAALRRAPFEYMPPDQKYLLSLYTGPHALLSGKVTPQSSAEHSQDEHQPATKDGSGNDRGTGSGEKKGRKGNRGGGSRGGDKAAASVSGQLSPDAWEEHLRYIQNVTTAYLDAIIKNDFFAQEWLTKDARRWLGDGADLLSK
jgi:dienelactone hydrolase